jgi:hypothetical protein
MFRNVPWGRLGLALACLAIVCLVIYVAGILAITWTLMLLIKVIAFIGTVIGHFGG